MVNVLAANRITSVTRVFEEVAIKGSVQLPSGDTIGNLSYPGASSLEKSLNLFVQRTLGQALIGQTPRANGPLHPREMAS